MMLDVLSNPSGTHCPAVHSISLFPAATNGKVSKGQDLILPTGLIHCT
jgi:hypothetical protein